MITEAALRMQRSESNNRDLAKAAGRRCIELMDKGEAWEDLAYGQARVAFSRARTALEWQGRKVRAMREAGPRPDAMQRMTGGEA